MKTLTVTEVSPRQVRLFIGGQWMDASDRKTFQQVSPATGDVMGFVADASREDARAAIAAAGRARRSMARLTVFERSGLCQRIADAIVARPCSL